MKKFILIVLVFATSLSITKAQDASLEESIDWLKGKLEGFSYSRFFDYGILPKDKGTKRYSYKLINSDKCSITIEQTLRSVTNANSTKDDYTTITHYKVNFSDVKSIEYSTSQTAFVIKSYNDEALIISTNASGGNYTKIKELTIYAQSIGDLSTRFPKAFKHAMDLCGAKEEKF